MTSLVSTNHFEALLADSNDLSYVYPEFEVISFCLKRIEELHADGILDEEQAQQLKKNYAVAVVSGESIISRYTEGDCWLLAVELNKLLGWTVIVNHYQGMDPNLEATHALVESPDGRLFDINGFCSAARIIDDFGGEEFSRVYQLDGFFEGWGCFDGAGYEETSQPFAQLIAGFLKMVYEL
jgi:hypothetical protein